jgi:hypothetical protein
MMEALLAVALHGRDLLRRVHDVVPQHEDPTLGSGPDQFAVHVHHEGPAGLVHDELDRVAAGLLLVGNVQDRVGIELRPGALVELRKGLAGGLALAVEPVKEHVRGEAEPLPEPVVQSQVLAVAI